MSDFPKITFGIIVLNGEPFTRYCLRSLYPFAHEIIVVEGGSRSAETIATADGHSTDHTLEELHRFKNEEDPENKVQIIIRDGFWNEKDDQSQAYAERATGDYLWQVDIDEFYRAKDMTSILELLRNDPEITAVSFEQITFWGGFDYIVDSWYLRNGANTYHRLFRWGKRYKYTTHRPPTVVDQDGNDVRSQKWIQPRRLKQKGIFLYHYSLVFPKQVEEKAQYYSKHSWANYSEGVIDWARQNFLNPVRKPFRVHNVYAYPSWIRKYSGPHPDQILVMQEDLEQGRLNIGCRDNKDVEMFESKLLYRAGRWILERLSRISVAKYFPHWQSAAIVFRINFDAAKNRFYWKK